ncbi:MAG: Holliday junction resolvase RuvX [Gammaproteobacteria bacterium]|nr:Holliday junction resolvase RuvX [Gammaproteobacteria bacterium]MDH3767176.1 Holliday junction resolvase RuvX [Gammaproteobacteria bacterium]
MKTPSGGPPSGTTLAFDFGARRIGVAVGDRTLASASGLTTLKARNGEADWVALDALISEWQPGVLVVGLPQHADGNESSMGAHARAFATSLETRYNLPVDMVDESLTSQAANAELRRLRRSGMLRRRVARGDSDRIAARLILEAWMARHSATE